MTRFVRSNKVRFQDCDSAGIVFYPNYFLMLNRLIEDWFGEALGLPWGILHHEHKQGVPTVSMQVQFKKASRIDEKMDWSLGVRRLGTKSFTLDVRASCAGEERIAMETVLVYVDLLPEGISSRKIPDDLRAKMERYLTAAAV